MYSFKTSVVGENATQEATWCIYGTRLVGLFSSAWSLFSRISLPDSQMPHVFHFQSSRAMATIASYQIVQGVRHTYSHANTCTSLALHQSQCTPLIPPVQCFEKRIKLSYIPHNTFFSPFFKYKLKFKTYYSALTPKDFDIVTQGGNHGKK